MKWKIIFSILVLISFAGIQNAHANDFYLNYFHTAYPFAAGTRIDNCVLCHISPTDHLRNPYGTAFQLQPTREPQTFINIQNFDSDGDGFTNIVEIQNLTFPGDINDFSPVFASSTPASPVVNSIVGGPTTTFTVTVNQPLNVSWLIDGTEVQNSITTGVDNQSTYSNSSVSRGTWNVTALAQKSGGGTASKIWTWIVGTPTATFGISGFKINNDTGMGIPGWTVTLTNGTITVPTTTNNDGMYQFTGLANDSYNVTEETRAGWTPMGAISLTVIINGADMANQNFTNAPLLQIEVTSFLLTPETNVDPTENNINITITAMNGIVPQPSYNRMANIAFTANNASAVNAPTNVSFVNGNATIDINSGVAQFVTITATNGTITGNTTVEFADFVIPLVKGWNLVSIPSFADPSDVTNALQLVSNNGFQTFDPATMKFVTPTDLVPLYGYWINVTADNQKLGFIADTGVIVVPPTRNLFEGWNLIGVSASSQTDPLNAGMVFGSLKYGKHFTEQYYSELVIYDEAQTPKTLAAGENDLTDLTDNTPLEKGQGYWLFIKNIPNTNENNVPWAGKTW